VQELVLREVYVIPAHIGHATQTLVLKPLMPAQLKQGIDDMINGRTVPHRQVMDELYHEFAPSYLVKSLEK
ncbi:MAG: hypothetical protein RL558_108, partial [Bacteroidota bacterium]